MKLVEIKDVRTGQVWINDQTGLLHTVDDLGGLSNAAKMETAKIRDEYLKAAKCRLIGKIGITHRIENNKLVEIKRKEVNKDDIVCFDEETNRLAVVLKVSPITITPTVFDGQEKELNRKVCVIGILGVTHEFVNDREVQQ
nr:MAG TPA: hypothetical protein [Herelleviridae sp.]